MPFVRTPSSSNPLPQSELSESGLGGSGGQPQRPVRPRWVLAALPAAVIAIGVIAVLAFASPSQVAGLTVMVAGAGMLLAVPFVSAVLRTGNDEVRERLKSAATTAGTVTAVEVHGTNHPTPGSFPHVRFRPRGGDEVEVRTARPHAPSKVGASVTVRYDPQNPEWVVVGDGNVEAAERNLRIVTLALIPGDLVVIALGAFLAFG